MSQQTSLITLALRLFSPSPETAWATSVTGGSYRNMATRNRHGDRLSPTRQARGNASAQRVVLTAVDSLSGHDPPHRQTVALRLLRRHPARTGQPKVKDAKRNSKSESTRNVAKEGSQEQRGVDAMDPESNQMRKDTAGKTGSQAEAIELRASRGPPLHKNKPRTGGPRDWSTRLGSAKRAMRSLARGAWTAAPYWVRRKGPP